MEKSMSRKAVLAPLVSIGLDLGSEKVMAALVDQAGKVVRTEEFELSPDVLSERFATERVLVLMESCNVSRWVHDLLVELGHEVVVCNPRRLTLIAKSTLKTDKLDAIVLGRLARLHQLDPELVQQSVVRTREVQLQRSTLAVRDQLVKQRTGCISSIRNVLRADALPRPTGDEKFRVNVEAMDLPDDVRDLITPLLVTLTTLDEQLAVMKKKTAALAARIPIIKKWREIPGVGELTSLAFALTIADPTRFKHARDVGPYLGFTPKLRQSSESEWRGSCTKAGDERTRRYFIQAAGVLMRCKQDSALKQWALKLAGRIGKKKAKVALARKLAVVMQHMWLTDQEFVPFPEKEVDVAA